MALPINTEVSAALFHLNKLSAAAAPRIIEKPPDDAIGLMGDAYMMSASWSYILNPPPLLILSYAFWAAFLSQFGLRMIDPRTKYDAKSVNYPCQKPQSPKHRVLNYDTRYLHLTQDRARHVIMLTAKILLPAKEHF